MRGTIAIILLLGTFSLPQTKEAPATTPLKNVKEIQLLPTVVNKPEKVKNPDAAALVEKALRRAVLANEFQVVESAPVKARISLDEFSGGSFAARFIVGFGAGRGTVDCRVQLLDQDGKEIAGTRVRVRGDMTWGAYQGNATQAKQAANKFEQALMNQIEKWK